MPTKNILWLKLNSETSNGWCQPVSPPEEYVVPENVIDSFKNKMGHN